MVHKFIHILIGAGSLLAGCQSATILPQTESIPVTENLAVSHLGEGVWIHTSSFDVPGVGHIAANGLVIIDDGQALLIDLPWTDELTGALFDWIVADQRAAVKTVLPTHFHEDSMGGLREAHRRGVNSYGLDKTVALARGRGLPVPRVPFRLRIALRCGRTVVVVTHHGPGHSTDNVVAWLPQRRVLFGGCLIKALDARSLGNTEDGNLDAYPATVAKVRAAYPQVRIVVPGHGDWGGPELIDHTLELCGDSGS